MSMLPKKRSVPAAFFSAGPPGIKKKGQKQLAPVCAAPVDLQRRLGDLVCWFSVENKRVLWTVRVGLRVT